MAIELVELVTDPIKDVFGQIIMALPGLLYAVIIVLIGWLIAWLISKLFKKILVRVIKLDRWIKRHHLDDAMGDIRLSTLLTKLLYWWIMIIFLGQAAMQLKMGMVSEIIRRFVLFSPNIFYAILLMVGGFFFADFVTDKIKSSKNVWADRIGLILEPVIVVIVALIALGQIGINVSLITTIILILIIAIAAGIALAIGLAFGLGMKDEAPKMWKNLCREWNKQRE